MIDSLIYYTVRLSNRNPMLGQIQEFLKGGVKMSETFRNADSH